MRCYYEHFLRAQVGDEQQDKLFRELIGAVVVAAPGDAGSLPRSGWGLFSGQDR